MKNTSKSLITLRKNFNSIQALECISNLNFYIKANDKDYLNILQQVCVFNIEQLNKEIQLLFMCTDISPFHSQYSSNSSKCKVINHKAINLFTNRELEILNLLSIGKK